jgi:hypothetical protein
MAALISARPTMPQATAMPAMAPVERPLDDELAADEVELELGEEVLLGADVVGRFPVAEGNEVEHESPGHSPCAAAVVLACSFRNSLVVALTPSTLFSSPIAK